MHFGLDIAHSASRWLELHGADAIPEARRPAAEMRARGDLDGADTWLRITVAVEDTRVVRTWNSLDEIAQKKAI